MEGVVNSPETSGWECVKRKEEKFEKIEKKERGEVEKTTWVTSVEIAGYLHGVCVSY
jgi:hypothetical protein